MNTTDLLLKLADIELSMLVSKAKLQLCTEAADLDLASDLWSLAFDCGAEYEMLLANFDEWNMTVMVMELKASIHQLFLPSFLKEAFNAGRADVCVSRMEA